MRFGLFSERNDRKNTNKKFQSKNFRDIFCEKLPKSRFYVPTSNLNNFFAIYSILLREKYVKDTYLKLGFYGFLWFTAEISAGSQCVCGGELAEFAIFRLSQAIEMVHKLLKKV